MFASPSFDASPPQPGGGASGGGSPPYEDDDDNEEPDDAVLFSSGDDEEEDEDDDDDDDDDDVDVDVDVEEEEEEEEEDDDDDDDDDDLDSVEGDRTQPAPGATVTTRPPPAGGAAAATATTTPTATAATTTTPMPPPPAHHNLDGSNGNTNNSTHLTIRAVPEIKLLSDKFREIGKEALCWQLSSAKPGNGVEQIRDGSTDTYWQSDGLKQPHWIQVHFARRVALSHVCLYLDYSLDESYTPKRVSVHHGMTSQDLQSAVYPALTEIEFAEPNGWCIIPLNAPPDPLDVYHPEQQQPPSCNSCIRAHLLRISILAMHQNGRDTHIRQVELYGPRRPDVLPALRPALQQQQQPQPMDDQDDDDEDEKENPVHVMEEDLALPRWSSLSTGAWGGGVVR